MGSINYQFLDQNKDLFMGFSKFDQMDLQRLYRKPGETELTTEEIDETAYNYDLPLFIKLIFRLKQNNNCPARFFNNVDWIVQSDILRKYFNTYLSPNEHNNYKEHLNFFSWIGNMVSVMEIHSMTDNESLAELWRGNTILFYYSINDDLQKRLIDMY